MLINKYEETRTTLDGRANNIKQKCENTLQYFGAVSSTGKQTPINEFFMKVSGFLGTYLKTKEKFAKSQQTQKLEKTKRSQSLPHVKTTPAASEAKLPRSRSAMDINLTATEVAAEVK